MQSQEQLIENYKKTYFKVTATSSGYTKLSELFQRLSPDGMSILTAWVDGEPKPMPSDHVRMQDWIRWGEKGWSEDE